MSAPEPPQLELFAPAERDQVQRNREALEARAAAIPAEIGRETAAVRARYADPRAELFPVAVTYVIPEGLAR